MKTILKRCVVVLGAALTVLAIESHGALAQDDDRQTVVLLSSVDTSHVHLPAYLFFMRHYYRTYERDLENTFSRYFSARGYRVEIHPLADQHDLWVALHSPRNVGVFWLSHAASAGSLGPGLGAGGEIADARGFDITDAFQDIHPNLRFLGVVGCQSESVILQQLESHGVRALNPELAISAFDRKIDAKKGLKLMLGLGDRALSAAAVEQGYTSPCPVRKGYELLVKRRLPERVTGPQAPPIFPALRIELSSGRVLGVFPAGVAGETQELMVDLDVPAPGALMDGFALKMIEDAGANAGATPEKVQIGELEFSEPWPGARWTPFATSSGELIGVTSHVYRYAGVDPNGVGPVDYSPFACEAMPPKNQK